MAETTNYGLFVTDDSTLPFLTWRQKLDSESNSNMTKIDMALKGIAGTVTATTMTASGWSNGTYSFESLYPSTTYNIFIEPDGNSITATQLESWNNAKILGSSAGNIYIAKDTVPSIDIPIILRVVNK